MTVLREVFDTVEARRGNTAMTLIARDPELSAEAAVARLLADPPAALRPAAPGEFGGGFLAPPHGAGLDDLHEITPDVACAALTAALRFDLAYDVELLPPDDAAGLAEAILAALGIDARWWTNSPVGRADDEEPAGPGMFRE